MFVYFLKISSGDRRDGKRDMMTVGHRSSFVLSHSLLKFIIDKRDLMNINIVIEVVLCKI